MSHLHWWEWDKSEAAFTTTSDRNQITSFFFPIGWFSPVAFNTLFIFNGFNQSDKEAANRCTHNSHIRFVNVNVISHSFKVNPSIQELNWINIVSELLYGSCSIWVIDDTSGLQWWESTKIWRGTLLPLLWNVPWLTRTGAWLNNTDPLCKYECVTAVSVSAVSLSGNYNALSLNNVP